MVYPQIQVDIHHRLFLAATFKGNLPDYLLDNPLSQKKQPRYQDYTLPETNVVQYHTLVYVEKVVSSL